MGDQEGGRDEEPLSNARKHETSSAVVEGGQGRVGRRQPEQESRSPVKGPPRFQELAVSRRLSGPWDLGSQPGVGPS